MRWPCALLFAALLAPAWAGEQGFKSDWEEKQEELDWREGEVTLPAYPRNADLIEFPVSAASDFRFFIDRATLSVGKDGVVRYTLVARSPSGVDNVSFEGMRCRTGTYRIYATGHSDGTWSKRFTDWRPVEQRTVQRWHQVLRRQFLCPFNTPIYDQAEGVMALERGRHPRFDGR